MKKTIIVLAVNILIQTILLIIYNVLQDTVLIGVHGALRFFLFCIIQGGFAVIFLRFYGKHQNFKVTYIVALVIFFASWCIVPILTRVFWGIIDGHFGWDFFFSGYLEFIIICLIESLIASLFFMKRKIPLARICNPCISNEIK